MNVMPLLGQPTRSERFYGGLIGGAVLFVLSFLLYGQSVGYPLLFLDDAIYFVGNPLLRKGQPDGALAVWTDIHYGYTPITHLTIWLDTWFKHECGVHGWWLARVHQLTWVGIGVLGVRALITRLTGSSAMGWWVACIYAVHPLCATTALWLAMRRQAVCLAFVWWGAVWFLRALQATEIRAVVTSTIVMILLVSAACLSRFNAISVILLYPILGMLTTGRGLGWRGGWLTAVLFMPVTAMVALLFAWPDPLSFASVRLGGTLGGTILLDGPILARYLLSLVWPLDLAAYYSVNENAAQWGRPLGAWLIVIGMAVALVLFGRDRRQQILLLGAAGAVVGPTLNLMNQVMAMADHYLQPAIPFIAVMVIRCLEPVAPRLMSLGIRRPAVVFGGGILAFFMAIAVSRNLHFSSSRAFILQALKASPNSGFMLGHALTYFGSLDDPESNEASDLAAVAAVAAPDFYRATHDARVQALHVTCGRLTADGRASEAQALLTQHTDKLAPMAVIYLRALILADSGESKAALGMLEHIAPVDRAFVEQVWANWQEGDRMPAVTTVAPGERPRGIVDITDALDGDQNAQIYLQRTLHALAQLHSFAGRHEAAAKYAMTLVAINPRMIHGWPVLAEALEAMGKHDRAAAARQRHAILKADMLTVSSFDD